MVCDVGQQSKGAVDGPGSLRRHRRGHAWLHRSCRPNLQGVPRSVVPAAITWQWVAGCQQDESIHRCSSAVDIGTVTASSTFSIERRRVTRGPRTTPLEIDGASLTGADVVAVSRENRPVLATEAALDRTERSWRLATEQAALRPVYGRTTGVGANRDVTLSPAAEIDNVPAASSDHGLRLLRSHAGGAGPSPVPGARASHAGRTHEPALRRRRGGAPQPRPRAG